MSFISLSRSHPQSQWDCKMLGLVVCQCVFIFCKQLSISSCCHTLPNSLEKVFYHFLQSLWWNWCQCLFVEMFVEFVNLTIAYCCDSIIKKHQLLLTNYTLLYQLPTTNHNHHYIQFNFQKKKMSLDSEDDSLLTVDHITLPTTNHNHHFTTFNSISNCHTTLKISNCHTTLKMTSTQDVETSFITNSPSQVSFHSDD